ncbi:MAG: aldehyde dehydrogenase (NADP(+)) [Planctomycetota bacterium]
MELHGKNLIGGQTSALGARTFRVVAPGGAGELGPDFHEASPEELERAMALASAAAGPFRAAGPETVARLLERIGEEILALGPALLERAARETALGIDRLAAERTRTVQQLSMFAALVREGSWVDARIDRAQPDRRPLPKPDVRRMLVPIGPVVVFCATNFPLAFSVAGGDTASALAARCPVVVKANRAHAGTAELVGRAVARAVEACGLPPGIFALLHGANHELNLALVRHPAARAVGFTGSLRGGRELFDAAVRRPHPIPVYAEMGSVNPVFLLPGALRERAEGIAEGLKASMTLGQGQFCTKPGVVFGPAGADFERFVAKLVRLVEGHPPGVLLHAGILRSYEEGLRRLSARAACAARSGATADPARTEAPAAVFRTTAEAYLEARELREEVFGPATVLVSCDSEGEFERVAGALEGHLTATLHGTPEDLGRHAGLVEILESKVGRLVFNGFPTGVEVCPSMHHGGPYPATTDAHFTSVGTAAIYRWARPVCYQNFPDEALPPELRRRNTRGIWRLVDGAWTKEDA